jgi:hypothetical protein
VSRSGVQLRATECEQQEAARHHKLGSKAPNVLFSCCCAPMCRMQLPGAGSCLAAVQVMAKAHKANVHIAASLHRPAQCAQRLTAELQHTVMQNPAHTTAQQPAAACLRLLTSYRPDSRLVSAARCRATAARACTPSMQSSPAGVAGGLSAAAGAGAAWTRACSSASCFAMRSFCATRSRFSSSCSCHTQYIQTD